MKNKYYLYSMLAAALILGSCDYNEEHFPGFDELAHPTHVWNDTIKLADTDYKTIADNSTNKEIALSKDPEGQTYQKALEAIGSNKYFTEDALAVWYLPAFIADKYPYMDNNSKVTVYYNNYENLPEYLKDFNGIKSYNLSSADYESVWGNRVTANYLSPQSISKIPSILKSVNPDATEGDMLLVNYAYSETEPSIGGSGSGSGETPGEPSWTQVATIPVRSAGQNWNFVNIGAVDLSAYKGQNINIGFKYTSTTQGGAKWELKNFKALSVPYLDVYLFDKQEDGSFKKIEYPSHFAGAGEYVIAALGLDNNYYPFGRLTDDSYTYGYMYPDPITVTQGTISAADAAYSVMTVEATGNGFSLKNAIGQYLYMSGTYDSFNVATTIETEGFDWAIQSTGGSDLFTITNVAKNKSVKLNYYVNKEGVASYSYGSYSSDKINGYTYAENSLLGNEGGFTIYNVNTGGLDYVWINDNTYGWIANGYANGSNHETEAYLVSPSIEIAEDAVLPYFTIDEAFRFGTIDNLTVWVSTDYQSSSTASLATTRASVTPNTTAVYRYSNNTWSRYSTDEATVAVLQPADYAQMGYSYISKPAETLPIYLQRTYPYAKTDDIVTVVYYSDSEGSIVATEFKYDGSSWTETTVATPSTITFQKSEGTWIEARVYLESTFLNGESGGFTAQDIELSGLSYVWKLDNSYGWKGSGYLNGNNATESYLISPEIDLSKAAAPTLVFDVAINYLSGNKLEDYLNVLVSADYAGDATTATWETLKITGWPEGSSWTFNTIEPASLEAYKGKKICIAIHYKSTTSVAPTVEIKNLSIKE